MFTQKEYIKPISKVISSFKHIERLAFDDAQDNGTSFNQYLAVRLQREKLERIKQYLYLYVTFFQYIDSSHLFYAQSVDTLALNIVDPSQDLDLYIKTLTRNILLNTEKDNACTVNKLGLFFLTSYVCFCCIMIGLRDNVAITSTASAIMIYVALHAACTILNYFLKNHQIKLINHNMVPPIDRQEIMLGNIETPPFTNDFSSNSNILLYFDTTHNKIMCSRILDDMTHIENFEINIDEAANNLLRSELASTQLLLPNYLLGDVCHAINQRSFSRALPNFTDANNRQPRFNEIAAGSVTELQDIFFNDNGTNSFGIHAVQENINEHIQEDETLRNTARILPI